MADVIVRVALELARAHGQHGRRALKGLDGGLFNQRTARAPGRAG